MSVNQESQTGSSSHDAPFEFGKNWARFQSTLNEARIRVAENSLRNLLQKDALNGCTFLDAGSGSGLFSLCAYRLGGQVTSFDVDQASVACTEELKRQYCDDKDRWRVLNGSLLDREFIDTIERCDFVYCWGVAHHTGNMWSAIDNILPLVKPGGSIVLAIYNDQLYISRAWRAVKQIYQRLPSFLRPLYIIAIGLGAFAKRLAVTLVACLLRLLTLRNPFLPLTNWIGETQSRGMHGWYDLVDWVGGWPFEVARPEEVFRHLRDRGFMLRELTTSIGHGCNEFVFERLEDELGSDERSKGTEVV
jgi:2-polyprenyl-6-hydroxyphenyl methylase/3-demethylubiquinone-9 3-methyltransferase